MKVTSLRYLDAKFHHPSPKIKKIPKNTNGRLAIPALAGLLVSYCYRCMVNKDFLLSNGFYLGLSATYSK